MFGCANGSICTINISFFLFDSFMNFEHTNTKQTGKWQQNSSDIKSSFIKRTPLPLLPPSSVNRDNEMHGKGNFNDTTIRRARTWTWRWRGDNRTIQTKYPKEEDKNNHTTNHLSLHLCRNFVIVSKLTSFRMHNKRNSLPLSVFK